MVEFTKFQSKWKIVKHFTKPQKRAALMKFFSLSPTHPHQIKSYYVFSYGDNRNKQTFAFKVLQESSFGRQETVECKCFSDTKQKHVAG